jgi:hypothetical protein
MHLLVWVGFLMGTFRACPVRTALVTSGELNSWFAYHRHPMT